MRDRIKKSKAAARSKGKVFEHIDILAPDGTKIEVWKCPMALYRRRI